MEAITVQNLVKRYRKADSNAIDDISFSVEQGEFFVLLGPNGAGKTTTVSVLTTTLVKTAGTVTMLGNNLDTDAAKIRQFVGIIFQGASLDLNLTAEENVRLHSSLYGLFPFRPLYRMMSREYKERIRELATVLRIEKDIFKPIKTLSGGMRRKLEIVRSLMHRPKILFLDEPTTGLDPISRRNLWGYLQDVRKSEKLTIFLTTHYLEEGEDADRICVINNGKIVSLAQPHEFKKNLVKECLIVDADDRPKLRKDLLRFTKDVSHEGPFRILLGGGVKAQDIIRAVSVPLTVLNIDRPTLEEAYLNLIDGESLSL
jgi:ABC-2 type transport system ATP-binding protein